MDRGCTDAEFVCSCGDRLASTASTTALLRNSTGNGQGVGEASQEKSNPQTVAGNQTMGLVKESTNRQSSVRPFKPLVSQVQLAAHPPLSAEYYDLRMTELDDAIATEMARLEVRAQGERLKATYAGNWWLGLPNDGPRDITSDFCARLSDDDGVPAVGIRWEDETYFANETLRPSFWERRKLTRERIGAIDGALQDGLPARTLELQDLEQSIKFGSLLGGPWMILVEPHYRNSSPRVRFGFESLMVRYLMARNR